MKILETGSYLPKCKVKSQKIEKDLNLEKGYIEKRTGIQTRYYAEDETLESMSIKVAEKILDQEKKQEVDLIIVATTTTDKLMPGISNIIQKYFGIEKCICLDILAGCSGFINALDIVNLYIESGRVKKALVIGTDILSKYTNQEDIATSIVLSDGAGAILVEKSEKEKKFTSMIWSESDENDILTCEVNKDIKMKGKEIYKYAVTRTVENVKELLKKSNLELNQIDYIVPHQSNQKIMNSIIGRLNIEKEKMYTNIESVGNTFCASIPIALDEMNKKKMLEKGKKIILLGYGGGLNTGSILIEI